MADTIVALSSGAGRSAVGVIRISGSSALSVLEGLCTTVPASRKAAVRKLYRNDGTLLDEALVLWFPEGQSFTGEMIVELQCHGGTAVIHAVLDEVLAFPDCRLAEPGEFTLRAFKDGRIDLAEVEALGDLIDAETEEQRRQSVRLLEGELHRRSHGWKEQLIRATALIEATIDWADEKVPTDVSPEVSQILENLIREMSEELATASAAERLRNGFEVAILGAPNAGKSSLINCLAGREAAITSPVPGTTRDVIELRYELSGMPVRFLDTAGLRDTADPVEQEGVRRAVERASAADLRLALETTDAPFPDDFSSLVMDRDIQIWTKSDKFYPNTTCHISISTETGSGVDLVLKEIGDYLGRRVAKAGVLGHRRQQEAVERSLNALVQARDRLESAPSELIAEDLRQSGRDLGRLTGAVDVEDILGEVFSRFCVGK